jgi:hypothetical protein
VHRTSHPIRKVLDELASEPRTVREIWTTVIDEHDSDASYAAIRDYIRFRRLAGPPGLPTPVVALPQLSGLS